MRYCHLLDNGCDVDENDDLLLSRPRCHSRHSSVASGFYSGPPTTDDEMRGPEAEEDQTAIVPRPAKVCSLQWNFQC